MNAASATATCEWIRLRKYRLPCRVFLCWSPACSAMSEASFLRATTNRCWRKSEFPRISCKIIIPIHRGMFCAGCIIRCNMPQGKLVRVGDGEILDVAVDLRRSSPTFGGWEAVRLVGREQADAVDPCRIRAWLPRDLGEGACSLQGDGLLRSGVRANAGVERS